MDDPLCGTCGRVMTPRASWTARGNTPKYCSERCRRNKPSDLDRELETAIVELLEERAGGATICPSEAARRVRTEWRPLMERARQAARRLTGRGEVEITQKGQVVDPSTAKGPIRIRRVR